MPDDIRVTRDDSALEYDVFVGDEQAGLIRFARDGSTITMLHTEVAPHHEGEGVGSELVQRALDDVRERGERVRPLCPFVAEYIQRHPDYADLVSED